MGKTIIFIIGLIVLVFVLVRFGGQVENGGRHSASSVAKDIALQTNDNDKSQNNQNETLERILETDELLGDPNAPITLVEFGDYQCTFCNKFFNESLPTLRSDYIDTGKINMIFRDLPVNGAESIKAARAAYCAGEQGEFWGFHDKLFKERTGYNNGQFSDGALVGYAQKYGLDIDAFKVCYDSDDAQDEIEADQRDAQRLGARGTPNFFIVTSDGGVAQVPGAQPLSWWVETFDKILLNK